MAILGRHGALPFVIGLCCICVLAVYSAPLSENSPSSVSNNSDSLLSAIEAVRRARRETAKSKSKQPVRSLVRYRYPIHTKRSGVEEVDDAEFPDDTDADLDVSKLVRAIALELLLESDSRDEASPQSLTSVNGDNREKASMRSSMIGDQGDQNNEKKKAKMRNLLDQLIDEDQVNIDNIDGTSQILEQLNQNAPTNDANSNDQDDGYDLTDEEEQAIYEAIIQELADEGESEFFLPQQYAGNSYKSQSRKRSPEWTKLPRASMRWRARFENDVMNGQQKPEAEMTEPWKSLSQRINAKMSGKGFHRGLRGMREDTRASQRDLTKWRLRNPSEIHKRSVPSTPEQYEGHSSSEQEIQSEADLSTQEHIALSRKRRSALLMDNASSKVQRTVTKTSSDFSKALDQNTNHSLSAPENTTDMDLKDTSQVESSDHSKSIHKKSVDWSDYFGYDKRSGSSDDQDVKDWLESEYYKMIAGSLASRRKRVTHGAHGMKRNPSSNQHADAEAALEAAFLASEDSRNIDSPSETEQFRALLTDQELADNLRDRFGQGMGDEAQDSFSQGSLQELAMSNAALNDDETDALNYWKRTYLPPILRLTPYKKNKGDRFRRKRYPLSTFSRSQGRRVTPQDEPAAKELGECPIVGRIVSTCNVVSHLMGGYRQLLTSACHQQEACVLCANDDEVCESEYYHRVTSLCGPDLLCRSQSRRLLSGLDDFHAMEEDLPKKSQEQLEAQCSRDHCLARFLERR